MVAISMLGLLGLAFVSGAEDWNQWRGPHRDGSSAVALPDPLPETLDREWRVAVGEGYGSPVAADGRVFLLTRENDRETVICLDPESGKTLWRHQYPAEFKENGYALKFGKGPFSTPLARDGKVVTVGVSGRVTCLEAERGKVLWDDEFDGDLSGNRVLFCGNTVSPLPVGNRVVAHMGDETHGRMTAYDLASGRKLWSWTGDISGYASPILTELDGQTQIVTLTQNKVTAIDPENGHLLWEHPYQVEWRENIVSPVVHGNGIIVSGREQAHIAKLEIARVSRAWTVSSAWTNAEQAMYMSTPLLAEGKLYGFSFKNKGQLFCLDPATGAILWQGPGRLGDNAALVRSGNYLLCLSTDAVLTVLALENDAYRAVRTYQVGESETWAHPLLMNGRILIKDKDQLTAWRF